MANLVANAYGAIAKVVGGIWPRLGGWGIGRLRLLQPSARFDWEREAGDTWRNSVVALGVTWLGDRFPRPKVNLARYNRQGELVPIPRHPVVDLWQRPNPFYSRRTMEKALGLSLKVDGNGFIQKVRDRSGQVVQLWYLPHWRVEPTWPDDGMTYIDGYKIRVDNDSYWLPKEEIIHIRDGIDLYNERLGCSALKSALREVAAVNMAAGYTASILKNSGVPTIAIIPQEGQQVDPNAAKNIKEKFVEKTSGDLIGSPVVLNGRYEVKVVGFSPDQLALDRLTRHALATLGAAVGVANMSMGLPDPDKTYANYEAANRASWGTVVSIQELIAEAIQHQLFPDFNLDIHGYEFQYDYSQIQEMQESLDAVHARVRDDFRFDIIRKNEARHELGYDDDPINGDLYFSDVQAKLKALGAPAADSPDSTGPTSGMPGDTQPGTESPTDTTARLKAISNGHANGAWRY